MTSRIYWPLLLGAAAMTGLAGCDSNGSTRIASVGARGAAGPAGPAGPAGAQGEQGPPGANGSQGLAGPAGPAGPQGPAGPPGANGSNGSNGHGGNGGNGNGNGGGHGNGGGNGSGSGDGLGNLGNLGDLDATDALATGGLVGSDGVAGTGLLANTGDPDSADGPTGGVLVQAGETVQDLAGTAGDAGAGLDDAVPGNTGLLAAAADTVDAEGQALVDAGNGDGYLVDGTAAATNDLVSAEANDQNLVGQGNNSQIGVSVGSDGQHEGELLTAGIASGGQDVTLESPVIEEGGLGGAVGSLTGGDTGGANGATGNLLETVEDTANSLLGNGQSGGGLLGGGRR